VWRGKKKQPCAAAAAAASAGKTKKDDKANDKAAHVKCEVTTDDVNVGVIVHFFGMKNKQSFNDHDAEVIQCLTNLVQVKFLQGPLKGPALHKLSYDKIIRIVKSTKPTDQGAAKTTTSAAGPTAQDEAAATSAAASTSPLAAAFSASSKGTSIDIERELEAVLEGEEANELFAEVGSLA